MAAPFDYDDLPAITNNASIRTLWPPAGPLSPPGLGAPVSGRPVANYTFALSYAINRWLGIPQGETGAAASATVAFHIVSIALHVLAALLLFATVRRTIRVGRIPEAWRDSADGIALAVASVWLIHPIQTEAVNYVAQRTELLVSVLYLMTVYSALRAWQAQRESAAGSPGARRAVVWSAVAVAACLLGMGTKEVMLTAPFIVVLFDRAFLFAGWREIWASPWRRRLYAGLFATTALSVVLIANGARAETVGFHLGISWYQYLYSQAWAIGRYLQLTLWPDRLTYDYGQSPVSDFSGVPGLVALSALAVLTLLAWRRPAWQWLGFLGAWFFMLLAPSSSIVPIRTEIAAERRIYLALASVIVIAVVGIEYARRVLVERHRSANSRRQSRALSACLALVGVAYFAASSWTGERVVPDDIPTQLIVRIGIAISAMLVVWCLVTQRNTRVHLATVALVVVAMAGTAFTRSTMYAHPELLWRDASIKEPNNARAFNSLAGVELRSDSQRLAVADTFAAHALRVDSTFLQAWVTRAAIAIKQGRLAAAESLLTRALQLSPDDSAATEKLGQVLMAEGQPERGIPYLRRVASWQPSGVALTNLGTAYLTAGNLDSAAVVLTRAVRADPTNITALRYLGGALIEQQRGAEAIPYLTDAARRDPTSGFGLGLLSVAYAEAQQPAAAADAARAAVARSPNDAATHAFAGRAALLSGQYQDAVTYLSHALRLEPNDLGSLTRLGIAEASMGNARDATRILERVLAVAPGYDLARRALDSLSRTGRR